MGEGAENRKGDTNKEWKHKSGRSGYYKENLQIRKLSASKTSTQPKEGPWPEHQYANYKMRPEENTLGETCRE